MSRGDSYRAFHQKAERLMVKAALSINPEIINVECRLLTSAAIAARELDRRGASVEAAALRNAIADYREAKGVR